MDYDVIIIGSGLAGLSAALAAAKKQKVLVITKESLTDCNTRYAQGGIAAVWSKNDTFATHIRDTMEAGSHHNDPGAVSFIVKRGPAAIRRMIRLGIVFHHTDSNGLSLNLEGGHSRNRVINAGDRSGMVIEETLSSRVKNHKRITVMEHALAGDLLVKKGVCYGVRVLIGETFTNLYAGKIILAGGGLAWIYENTTNPSTATGDTIALAKMAGAETADLEFIQFHPTALKTTVDRRNTPIFFLLSETLRGQGARLIDRKGRRFMHDIHPLGDLAPRDIISRTVFQEQKKGPVYLDCRMIPAKIFRHDFSRIYEHLRKKGFDPRKEPIPITPAAHYTCGGIKTDLKGRTNIANLYACGETACTGLHGANRLASNSLLEATVMGERTGTEPPSRKNKDRPDFPSISYKKQPSTISARKQIRRIMWNEVGIVRTGSGIKKALKELTAIQEKLPPPTDRESIITRNIMVSALLVTRAALHRKKSMGCHFIITPKAAI